MGKKLTKNELRKLIPSIRFSGKSKSVHADGLNLNGIQANAVIDFAVKNGYSYTI